MKLNKRKQFAQELCGKTDTELLALQQTTQAEYERAQTEGSMSLASVLYFDIQQIISEMDARKSTE